MVSLDVLNGEIAQLEQRELTYATVEKLAWLYIVRDKHVLAAPTSEVSNESVSVNGESDFLKACAGKSITDVLTVMNEIMETIKVLHPKLYQAVMDRLA